MVVTDIQFRLFLIAFVALVLWQVLYSAPREMASAEQNTECMFGWIKKLSPRRLKLLLVIGIANIAGGLIGIIGMFFLIRWAVVVYFVATLLAKAQSYFLHRGGDKSPLEKALVHAVSVGEALLFYLVFIGPAKELFQ